MEACLSGKSQLRACAKVTPSSSIQADGEGNEDDAEHENSGFDLHVLQKAVDRFIASCKSLMLEYEKSCKDRAASAIMDWTVQKLAGIGL
jgi:hypothetical protein